MGPRDFIFSLDRKGLPTPAEWGKVETIERLCLCEGESDARLVYAVANELHGSARPDMLASFAILDCQGEGRMPEGLALVILGQNTSPKLRSVCVIRDSDGDIAKSTAKARAVFSGNKLVVPIGPDTWSSGKPSTGFHFIDAVIGGTMLEDLLLQSVAGAEPNTIGAIRSLLSTSLTETGRVPRRSPKAQMAAWLATQTRNYLTLNQALDDAAVPFDVNHTAFDPLRTFLLSMP